MTIHVNPAISWLSISEPPRSTMRAFAVPRSDTVSSSWSRFRPDVGSSTFWKRHRDPAFVLRLEPDEESQELSGHSHSRHLRPEVGQLLDICRVDDHSVPAEV